MHFTLIGQHCRYVILPTLLCAAAPCYQTSSTIQSTENHDKYVQSFDCWNGFSCITATSRKSILCKFACDNQPHPPLISIDNLLMHTLQAMSLYWSVSSSYGLVQNILFRFPRVRRTLGIPRTPSESKHPYRDLLAIIEQKTKAYIRLQRK